MIVTKKGNKISLTAETKEDAQSLTSAIRKTSEWLESEEKKRASLILTPLSIEDLDLSELKALRELSHNRCFSIEYSIENYGPFTQERMAEVLAQLVFFQNLRDKLEKIINAK